MTHFHRIPLQKAVVYLTEREILKLLMQNKEVYRTGLERGKIFSRSEAKQKQYEKKYSKHESQRLNDLLE